jgi:outer membrane protein assembly factor BamB
VPAEYLGFAAEPSLLDDAAKKELAAADSALAKEKWEEATAILTKLLGSSRKEKKGPAPRIGKEVEPLFTADGLLFTSMAVEVERRLQKIPGREAAKPEVARPEARGDPDWRVAGSRPDHAAIPLAPDAQVEQGSYARWVHRLTNYRVLESSQPARNFYYAYFPMQMVSLGELLFARSHQDVVAFERTTGRVRWRVDSELPPGEQSHQRTSGFDSFRFFSDLGGWALTALPGAPDRVIVVSKSGRGPQSAAGGKVQFQRNRLRAYDAGTGALSWERGGAEDPDEILHELTFLAPPTPAQGSEGEVLVAPATSDDGYFVLGLTAEGKLLWTAKVYAYLSSESTWIGENLALGSSLAGSGQILVGAPGHGLVFAITPEGEVLWEARYPSGARRVATSPRWAPGHPIIVGEKAIAAPFDGDVLLALEVRTGKTLWEKQYSTGYFNLIGADADRAYLMQVDGHVTAVSLLDGSLAWTSEPIGSPAGRGIVTSKQVLVPVEKAIVLLDPSKGTVVAKSKIWDESIPQPSPGNLFLVRGAIFLGAPWGYAQMDTYEATWKTLDTLGVREQLLRRSRLLSQQGKYVEALEGLRKVLGSASEDSEREKLRAELLEVSNEAAASTKDLNFIRRVLDQPEVVATRGLRTAFLLKSAELLREEAPGEVAEMYREIVDEAPSGDLVVSPDGVLVDVGVYASDALRDLVASGRASPKPSEEEKVKGWVEGPSSDENRLERLSRVEVRYSHALVSANAEALLAAEAETEGDPVRARNHIERMLSDHPRLSSAPELRDFLRDLRQRAGPERLVACPALSKIDIQKPWERRFGGKSEGGELVSMAQGSDPFPGVLALGDRSLVISLDGKTSRKVDLPDFPDLKDARSKVKSVLVEPATAFFQAGHLLLFTAAGLYEILDAAGNEPRARVWLSLEHPLLRVPSQGNVTVTVRRGNTVSQQAQPAGTISDNTNFYPRAEFDARGDPSMVGPDGVLVVFEGRTGRIRYKSAGQGEASSGPVRRSGDLAATELSKPPGVAIHELRSRSRLVISTPSTPWKSALVNGIAVVIDSPAGIQVRDLPSFGSEGEEASSRTLWRDLKARGFLSLVHADATQVLLVEGGGRLVSRALRSGRVRWSVPFPDGASPIRALELEEPDGEPGGGDLLIVAARKVDPEDGRGVLGGKIAEDLFLVRVSLQGQKRWETLVAKGGVACDGTILVHGEESWILFFNQKAKEWSARAVVVNPKQGAVRELFHTDLETKPNYPPPKVQATAGGIAVGNFGAWSFFN